MAQKEEKPIQVVKAEPGRVEIKIIDIIFVFTLFNNKLKFLSKSKPDAQIYDPDNLWVPKELFSKACRQAAKILKEKQKCFANLKKSI